MQWLPDPPSFGRMPAKTTSLLRIGVAMAVVLGVANVVLASLPYPWGMVWFSVNQPLSGLVEDAVGISGETQGWLVAISLVNAMLWTVLPLGVAAVVRLASHRL